MAKFIVVREEYDRSCSGPLTVELREASDIRALIVELEHVDLLEEEEDYDPLEWLSAANGDGMDSYIIKQLLPNGTLSNDLLS